MAGQLLQLQASLKREKAKMAEVIRTANEDNDNDAAATAAQQQVGDGRWNEA